MPNRPPRDVEGLNRVLATLGWVLAAIAAGVLVYGSWRVVAELRAGSSGEPADEALLVVSLLVVFTALSVGCLRLSRDDGTGTWCEECVARNPSNAPLCETCGAELP